MGAGNRNGLALGSELTEELIPLEHRDTGGAGGEDFNIVIWDGRRAHDQAGAAHIVSVVTDSDRNASHQQAVCQGRQDPV